MIPTNNPFLQKLNIIGLTIGCLAGAAWPVLLMVGSHMDAQREAACSTTAVDLLACHTDIHTHHWAAGWIPGR